jgi:hypothetical protein
MVGVASTTRRVRDGRIKNQKGRLEGVRIFFSAALWAYQEQGLKNLKTRKAYWRYTIHMFRRFLTQNHLSTAPNYLTVTSTAGPQFTHHAS